MIHLSPGPWVLYFIIISFLVVFRSGFCVALSSIPQIWLLIEVRLWGFMFLSLRGGALSINRLTLLHLYILQSLSSVFMLLAYAISVVPVYHIALAFKVGLWPFHNWIIRILGSLSLPSLFVFRTVMKIPSIVAWATLSPAFVLRLVPLVSIIVGGLGGIGVSSVIYLILWSSVSQSGWLIFIRRISVSVSLIYWLGYAFLVLVLFSDIYSAKPQQQLKTIDNKLGLTPSISLTVLSIAGLPPFMGFLLKWGGLYALSYRRGWIVLIILWATLLSLYWYRAWAFLSLLFPAQATSSSHFWVVLLINILPRVILAI